MPYTVYWIHREDHTDPYVEGYVGVSKTPDLRFKSHAKSKKNMKVRNAISTGAFMEPLVEGLLLEEAMELEKQYRPEENIGWNFAAGGGVPPTQTGITHEANVRVGDQRSEKQKLASQEHSQRMAGRTSPRKGAVLTDETRQKISASKMGVPRSEETRKRMQEHHSSSDSHLHKEVTCPHCGKSGRLGTMKRWHFDRCPKAGG